jgi:integrase
VLEHYALHRAPKVADPARIAYAIEALSPFWQSLAVQDITPSLCDRYQRERGKAIGTIRRELTTLRAAVNFSVREGILTRPVHVPLPQKPDGKDRWLTKSEAARLLNAARTARGDVRLYLPIFILVGLYTGARCEAVLSLKWSQVDFERGRINFRKPGASKTIKGRAHIPMPDRLRTFLQYAWQRRTSDIGPVIHLNGAPILDIGGGWNGTLANGSFGTACKRAELIGVTPHTLRHTCGTWLAQAGTDLWDIAGWLGQSLASTTELYAHHHPDFMGSAKKAADRRK